MTSVPPPGPRSEWLHPSPVPDPPEVPDGITPAPPADERAWRPLSGLFALVAAFGAAIAGAIFIAAVAGIAGASFEDPPPSVNISAVVVQDLALIGAAVFFASLAARPRPSHFGLRPTAFGPAAGWTILAYGAFFAISALWISGLGIDEEDKLPDELGVDESSIALIAVAVLVTVVAPIAEEFFFRGYFFTALRNWRGLWPAALITGIVFGGIHIASSPVGFLMPLAVFGVVLCLLYARTGSLYPSIALHAINNSIAFGASQDWGWEIAPLMAGALALISLVMLGVRRRWPEPGRAGPATA